MPAIPLTVTTTRLEEDSVPNYMPYHMQPVLHQELVGRSWPSSNDPVTSKDEHQPSVTTVGHKTMPDVDDVKKHVPVNQQTAQAPASPETDKVDNNTQTG